MQYDLIIFGFNNFSLLLSYEMSRYNLKIAVVDKSRNHNKIYLNKDSVIIYNGVSSFNGGKFKENKCYEFIKDICDKFDIKYELMDFKFIRNNKEFISNDCILINLTNVEDVLYNVSSKNNVDFIFDDELKDYKKENDEFKICGNCNDITSNMIIDTRNLRNYKYILTTYTLDLDFCEYFKEFHYYKKNDYEVIFYKNFIGKLKIDIIHDINLNVNHFDIIKNFIRSTDADSIIVKQVEYLKYSLFEDESLEDFCVNKNYLGFNSTFNCVYGIVRKLKERFNIVNEVSDINYDKYNLENIDKDMFNEIICYCNLLSKGDIIKIVKNGNVTKLEELLYRVDCRFNNCIDCYDKMCNIIVEYTGNSIYEVCDENILRIKNFNGI